MLPGATRSVAGSNPATPTFGSRASAREGGMDATPHVRTGAPDECAPQRTYRGSATQAFRHGHA